MLLLKLPNHFTIHPGVFLSLKLCSSHAGTTLSKAPIMLSDGSIATPSLVCHVAWICWKRKSRAVSMDLLGQAPMCWAGRSLCSSDKDKVHRAMTLSRTFSRVLSRAMGHQAPGAE